MSVGTGALAWLSRATIHMGTTFKGALFATAPVLVSFDKIAGLLMPKPTLAHRLIPVRSRDEARHSNSPTQTMCTQGHQSGGRGLIDDF